MEAATAKDTRGPEQKPGEKQDEDLKAAAARPEERAKSETSYTVLASETGEDGSYVKIGRVNAPSGNQREARKRALALPENAELRDKISKGETVHVCAQSSWSPFPVHIEVREPDLVY